MRTPHRSSQRCLLPQPRAARGTAAEQSGFTLIEVLISASLTLAIAGACLTTQTTSTRLMSETVVRSQLEEAACFADDQVAFDTRWADRTSLVLSTENGSSRLDMHLPTGYAGGNPVWGTTITYHVVPSAIDANGDGVHDEYKLVRLQDGKTKTICDGIVAGGFTATRTGTSVALQVRLARKMGGRLVTMAGGTSATFRN